MGTVTITITGTTTTIIIDRVSYSSTDPIVRIVQRVWCSLAIAVLLLGGGCATHAIVGIERYQFCPFDCMFIVLRDDGTFRYEPSRELGEPTFIEGRWEPAGRGRIRVHQTGSFWAAPDHKHDGITFDLARMGPDGPSIAALSVTVQLTMTDGRRFTDVTDEKAQVHFPRGGPAHVIVNSGLPDETRFDLRDFSDRNLFFLFLERTSSWKPLDGIWRVNGRRVALADSGPFEYKRMTK